MHIITSAKGIQYRRQEFIDAWGRKRVCDKLLSELPKPHNKTCSACCAPIAGSRSTKQFCSDACKMRDYRKRQAVRRLIAANKNTLG